jgi:hypothetical protein
MVNTGIQERRPLGAFSFSQPAKRSAVDAATFVTPGIRVVKHVVAFLL